MGPFAARKRNRFRPAAGLIAAATLAAPAAALVYVVPTDETMVRNSPVIVYGEVLGTAPGPAGARPSTDVVLRVHDVLKGTVPGDSLVVRQPGGVAANGRATRILGLRMLAEGDRVLLFLDSASGQVYRAVQLGLGVFFETSSAGRPLLERDGFRHQETELAHAHEAHATSLERQPREAGAFRRWIVDRAAGVERAPDYFAVDLPERPAVVASPYALLGSNGASCEEGGLPLRHRLPDSDMDIGFVVHGSQQGLTNTGDLISSAMAAWNAVARSTARMVVSSTSTDAFPAELDGKNSIGFEDPHGDIEGSYDRTSGGLLAVAFYSYACDTTTPPHEAPISGTRAYEMVEVDIVTQDGFHRFLDSSEADTNGERFEAIIGHELGHALGLAHSGFLYALMRASITDPNSGALLHTDDKRAVRSLYPTVAAVRPRAVAEAPDVSWVEGGLGVIWANVVTGAAEDPTGYDIVFDATAPHSGGGYASIFADEDYPGNPTRIRATLFGSLVDRCKSYRVAVFSTNDAGRGESSPYGSVSTTCPGDGGDGGDGDRGDGDGGGGGGGGGGSPAPQPPDPEPPPPPPPPPVPPRASFTVDVQCPDDLCGALTGQTVTFTDTSSGTVARRSWDFDVVAGRPPAASSVRHAWPMPGFFRVTLTVSGAGSDSTASRVFLIEAGEPAGTCQADAKTRCLQDSRYQVRTTWRHPDGNDLAARVARAGTNDSGLFWFHDAENWEVLVKVLDGCSINGADWLFVASPTDLGFDVVVTDTVTGEVRTYSNEPGTPAPAVTDTGAFKDRCRP